MAKLYDLAVVTRKYTNDKGEEKAVWKNVGCIVETKKGGKVIILDRTFNPAGCPNPENQDTVVLSMFEPKDKSENVEHSEQKANAYLPQAKAQASTSFDDDIPF